jgi:multidrug efflux pump subunit AcrB
MDPIPAQPGPAASAPTPDLTAGAGEMKASWIVRTSISNPYAVIVMALAILVIGSVCLTKIPVDLLPAYKTPAVQVLTLYPGMPAEIVERDMTNRLERWTSQADGISRQESRSMIGVSVLKDYFRDDIDPNTAMSQVSALAISDMYYLPPGTVPPMVMLFDPTATLPTALLAASSDTLNETQVYDLSYFNVRNMLSGTPGVIAPAVFGGRLRRVYIYLDQDKLKAHNLSLMDVQKAIKQSNLMIPTGDAKIGDRQYSINMESMVPEVKDFNNIPIKWEGEEPVLVRDVGKAEDTYAIQTNAVRISESPAWESKRQVYIPVYRRPGANTIQVVEGIKERIPEFKGRLPMPAGKGPDDLNLKVVADQSVYVRENINNLLWEGALGGLLASLMILIFLGSVRSTVVIALTIPLSALVAVIGLYFMGQTLNAMTLGGLALVMGRLVDDAIVDVENTVRHLDMGSPPKRAALESAMEIAVPVLVSTITTVAVFIPVIFLSGMAKYLFTPLALSVAFAMFASYLLSRTISPAYCAYMLRGDSWYWQALCWVADRSAPARLVKALCQGISAVWAAFHRLSDQAQQALTGLYAACLRAALRVRYLVLLGGMAAFAASFLLYPLIGKELFPQIDAGQFVIGVRAPAGMRLENTEEITQRVEKIIQEEVPAHDRQMIVTNIGVLYDWPAGYTPNAGPMDATMLVQLAPQQDRQTSAQEFADRLRGRLAREIPGVQFSIDTGGLVSSALNFGLPSPINLQVEGRDMKTQYRIAERLKEIVAQVPGAVDVRIQETVDYPTIDIDPDRVKMLKLGITQEDAVKNLMSVTNSSTSFDPAFWLDYRMGNHYFVGVTYREKNINSLATLENTPITGSLSEKPRVLRDVANLKYGKASVEVSHLNLTRVINVYANVSGRDVGSVAADVESKLNDWGERQTGGTITLPSWTPVDEFKSQDEGKQLLTGYTVRMRGEVASMQESFASLGSGLLLATILIYLIMIAQFRSFLDPFIIMFAVPLGIIGVLVTLVVTGTTINVQSFLGVIFMVGIAVSNSILLVEFANRLRREQGLSPHDAAVKAASIRLRPILMTSLAAIIGLLPMALRSGEANTPLARAVIGGLSVSTVLTLFVVPCLYVILKRGQAAPRGEEV